MLKQFIFVAFILIAVFAHGNHDHSHDHDDSHKPAKKYHFIGGYNSTYSCNDCVYTQPIWDEVIKRNPTWSDYITPVPFLSIEQFYEEAVQCYQDASVVTYPWYPEYGNMPHFPPYFSKLAFIGFSNMPRSPVDHNTSHPCPGLAPTCASIDYCTTQDYHSAAELSNTNNAPIYIHYDPTKLYVHFVNDIKNRLVEAGAKNVSVVVDEYDEKTYFNLMMRVGTIDPAHEIHFLPNPYFDDFYCQTIKSQGIQLPFLSEFNYPIYSPGFGFPTCLNNTKFVHDLQKTMNEILEDGTLCEIFTHNPMWCLLPYYVQNDLIAPEYKQCLKVWKVCQF